MILTYIWNKIIFQVWSRCAICKQFFPTDFDRQSHGLKDHCEVLKTIKCWYCPIESSSNKEFFNHAHILHKEKVQKEWTKCSKCADYRLFFFRSTFLSQIDPKYDDRLCQIYEDLHKLFWNSKHFDFRTICVNLRKSDEISHPFFG